MFLFKNFSLVPVKPILAFDKKFGEILKVFIHFQLMDFHSPLSNSSKQNNLVLRTWSEQFCPVSQIYSMIVINNHHYPDHFQSLLMMHHYHCHHHHCHWPVKMESLSPLHLIKGFSLNDHQNKTGNSEEQKKLILEGRLTLFSLQREKI